MLSCPVRERGSGCLRKHMKTFPAKYYVDPPRVARDVVSTSCPVLCSLRDQDTRQRHNCTVAAFASSVVRSLRSAGDEIWASAGLGLNAKKKKKKNSILLRDLLRYMTIQRVENEYIYLIIVINLFLFNFLLPAWKRTPPCTVSNVVKYYHILKSSVLTFSGAHPLWGLPLKSYNKNSNNVHSKLKLSSFRF